MRYLREVAEHFEPVALVAAVIYASAALVLIYDIATHH